MNEAPVVILVRPQLGENIGAAARAMSNFGLGELRLVAPRDGWPNQRALEVASGGTQIIENARLFPDFASAMADIEQAFATTARPRDMRKRVLTPKEAMAGLTRKTAFVFGPERTGLENEEIVLCDTLITIPTAQNASLNLAQCVVVMAYEWFQTMQTTSPAAANEKADALASKTDWLGLFEQLESYLDQTNYYRVNHKKPIMWQNLQTMLMRGAWSEQEIRSFRGMLRAIWERRRRNSDPETYP